jgi:hypothetical protein
MDISVLSRANDIQIPSQSMLKLKTHSDFHDLFDFDMSKSTNTVVYFDWKTNLYLPLRKMSHTIYITRIILRHLSALFGLQFMLPIEKSVTFTGACANEIIPNGLLAHLFTK